MIRRLAPYKAWLCVVFLLIVSSVSIAANLDVEQTRLETVKRQLAFDQKNNQVATKQLDYLTNNRDAWIEYYRTNPISQSDVRHARLDIIAATTALNGINIAISSAQDMVANTKENIAQLMKQKRQLVLLGEEKEPSALTYIAELDKQIAVQEAILNLENERISVLLSTRSVAEERISFLEDWSLKLNRLYQKYEQKIHMTESAVQVKKLQDQLEEWLNKSAELNTKLMTKTTEDTVKNGEIEKLHLDIVEATERVEMTRMEIYLHRLHNSIQSIRAPSRKTYTVTSLNTLDKQANKIVLQLDAAKDFIKKKSDYLGEKKEEYKKHLDAEYLPDFLAVITKLDKDYLSKQKDIEQLLGQTAEIQKHIKELLKIEVSSRQVLPGVNIDGWIALGSSVAEIPGLFKYSLINSVKQIKMEMSAFTGWHFYSLVFVLLGLLFGWLLLRRYLTNLTVTLMDKRQRFSTNIIYVLVEVMRRDLFSVLVLIFIAGTSYITGIHAKLYLYLVIVYLLFKTLITMTRLLLLETVTDISGSDVANYKKLRAVFIFGGVLSAILVITHNLPVHYEVKGLSNRVFMLFIFALGWLVFKSRRVIPELFEANLPVRRRYVFHTLRLLSFLIPLAFISNALIGLLGYVEFAWLMSKYQVIFLAVLFAYLITRGLFIDFIDYLSEKVIRFVKNGWVWSEVVLRPLDKVLRVALFLATLMLLVHVYDLDKDVAFLTFWTGLLNKSLLEIGGNIITPLVTIELVIVFMVLAWIARWSREFSFRWLYAKARDVGVRHSLSVFTQYIVVILGVVIGLKILGIDLTGFAVVAAAFAAGLGFGLRDMLNNFFSGILLLVERPFRTGDIVQIGEHEGRVIQTGMRSMTIRTWDHMELIVPNSDLFTKPFVNWTHQDSLVRTVIRLNVNRSDNPHEIHDIIMAVLNNLDVVVDNPEPEVFMKEVSDSLIEMEVRYYIILSPTTTRAKVRSDVLFAIWDSFKEHGIKPPFERYDLQLIQG